MGKIKAVIFDMDGVLIEAKDWHYEALNRALGLFGQSISRYDHLVTYDGLPTMMKLEMMTVERGLPRSLHEFINDIKQQYTLDMVFTRCKPTFTHQFALSQLKKDGYKLGVASNSVRITVESMMNKSALAEYLDFMLSNQDVEKPKPDPEMYNNAISYLGLTPQECLIVEDNENGIKAARASGAYVLEVLSVDDVNYKNITNKIKKIEAL
ncbi:Hydrolase in polyol utilization gene cluster, haloacid dehalogenase-like family [hydrothermal vent metagenome]|uniref:Hydrolase in polyol utilization gene cluster, haloacid dehalogenase-like family n=1 Tax=hydrothermal vent metagenome TaxID=652676 RepID=A0A3B0XQP6_9ZZZZ